MEPTPARKPSADAPRGWRRMLTFPSPYTVLMAVIVLAAIATWVFPSGAYSTIAYDEDARALVVTSPDTTLSYPATQATLDRLGIPARVEDFVAGKFSKPVGVPGTYVRTPPSPQGPLAVLRAPIEGIYGAIGVILFVLVIGGFIGVFNRSGAFDAGIGALARRLRGRESWLIVIVTTLMALGGTTFGMAEETIAFYPLLVPVFLAAGYDSLVPLAVILGGSHIGGMASTTNPFATIIASQAAGVSWEVGTVGRVVVFVVSTALLIGYILHYAKRVKANPDASLTRRRPVVSADPEDTTVPAAAPAADATTKAPPPMTLRVAVALTLFALTFVAMIVGVSRLDWWFPEMTALFLGASLVIALVEWPGEKQFVTTFIHGAKDLLGVAFVIGIARGVEVVMDHGGLKWTIIEATSGWVAGMPPVLFVIALLGVFFLLAFFVPSSTGVAMLTMPIMGALALQVGVPTEELVSAYSYGIGLMFFVAPSGMVLPSLAMVDVGYDAWLRFITPFLLVIAAICAVALAVGVLF